MIPPLFWWHPLVNVHFAPQMPLSGDVTQAFSLKQRVMLRDLVADYVKHLKLEEAPRRALLVAPSKDGELEVAVSLLEKLDTPRPL